MQTSGNKYDPEQIVTLGDIKMPAADALCALYNASRPQGLGALHFTSGAMDRREAAKFLAASNGYADYVNGRVVKVRFRGELDTWGYDRDLGNGATERALRAYQEATR